MAAMNFL